jgi:hypothetical protein
MSSGSEKTMNRILQRRIELLETRFEPAWEPLRVVVKAIPPDYVPSAGERVVEDEYFEGQDRQCPLMLTVHERITTDPKDLGRQWSDRL